MSADSVERDDRARWEARYAEGRSELEQRPSEWVVRQCLALPDDCIVVDVAGGAGRHATPLIRSGRTVVVVDFSLGAVQLARSRPPAPLGVVADLAALPIRDGSVDAIVCVNFLDRDVFASLVAALRPGGALIYETFTRRHLELVEAGRAHGPRNPAYLLDAGELRRLVAPLAVREYDERLVVDDAGARHVARVVAVKA